MLGIGNIAEQMGAGIERCQLLLQLRSGGEHRIHHAAEIPFCLIQRFRGHPRLGLNAIHAVINRGLKAAEFQIKACVGIEAPQQGCAQIKPPIGPEQGQVQTPAVQTAADSAGSAGPNQGGQHPDALAHPTQGLKATAQATQNPSTVGLSRPCRTDAQGVDVNNAMTGFSQRNSQVLLVGPERMIPVRCGQQDDISHGRQSSSSIAISRKLGDRDLSVAKSPEARMPPSAIS